MGNYKLYAFLQTQARVLQVPDARVTWYGWARTQLDGGSRDLRPIEAIIRQSVLVGEPRWLPHASDALGENQIKRDRGDIALLP